MRSIEAAAPSLGVQAMPMPVRATSDIEPAIESFARVPNGGLIFLPDAYTSTNRETIVALIAPHKLPAP